VRRYSDNYELGSLSELNVTPLLDLAFVLLVIFMITAPLLGGSSDLILPTSTASDNAIDPSSLHMLRAGINGELSLDGLALAGLAELPTALQGLRDTDTDTSILIEADRAMTVQALVGVMDQIKQAGITRVGILTKNPDSNGEGAP